jgi:hypothetical protein
MRRFICIVLAAAIAATAAPWAWTGAACAQEAPGGHQAPAGFSLRYIPEAQPLSSATDEPVALFQETGDAAPGELSAKRAVLYSLLLPGLGDWYAGRKDRAKTFFIVDAALWTSFIVFQVQGHRREDAYKQMAVDMAGVTSTGHSDDFYSEIGAYDNSGDYETIFKQDHRIDIWPEVGYEALESYYLENRVSDFEEWAWANSEQRIDFRQLKTSSKNAYRRSKYVIALAVANRLVASVFAYHAVKSSRNQSYEREEVGASGSRGGSYHVDFSSPSFARPGEYAAAISVVRSF